MNPYLTQTQTLKHAGDLAASLGISRVTLYRIRTGQRRSKRVEKALRRMGIPIATIA